MLTETATVNLVTESNAFMANILARPKDDGVRGVYADWLLDHGMDELADFVLYQLRHPTSKFCYALPQGHYRQGGASRYHVSEDEYADTKRWRWFQQYAPELLKLVPGRWTYTWRRGFVDEVEGLTSAEWLDFCDLLTGTFPLTMVGLRSRLTFGRNTRDGSMWHRPHVLHLASSEGFGGTRKKRTCTAAVQGYEHQTLMTLSGGDPIPWLVKAEWPNIKITMPSREGRRDDRGRWMSNDDD